MKILTAVSAAFIAASVAACCCGGPAKSPPAAGSTEPANKITRYNYNWIRDGETLEDVQRMLGPGKEASRAGNLLTLTWQHESTIIVITFEDGKVKAKSITGN